MERREFVMIRQSLFLLYEYDLLFLFREADMRLYRIFTGCIYREDILRYKRGETCDGFWLSLVGKYRQQMKTINSEHADNIFYYYSFKIFSRF